MLQNIQREISNTLEDQVFRHIVRNKFGENAPIPRPIWNPLYAKDENDITSRIVSLVSSGIITINEGRQWLFDIGITLGPIEGGEKIQELERFKQEVETNKLMLEQSKQELENPPEEVSASYEKDPQKWINLEPKDTKKDITNRPNEPSSRISGRYKIQEALKMDGISVFSVNDSNIRIDLDPEWSGSGSYKNKDYISENEIWVSSNLSDVRWAEKLKKEIANLDAPMQEYTDSNQLMFPELKKKKKGDK